VYSPSGGVAAVGAPGLEILFLDDRRCLDDRLFDRCLDRYLDGDRFQDRFVRLSLQKLVQR
jgi:hypothetical protein